MKSKNAPLLLAIVFFVSIFLTGCYRDKLAINEARAKEELILIEKAKEYTNRFIASHAELEKHINDSTFLKSHFDLPNAESFNRDMIGLLLNQEGADGIRIYYGEDEKGQIRLVLLPVDKNGNDIENKMLTTQIHVPGIPSAYAYGNDGQAGETGQGCYPCTIK